MICPTGVVPEAGTFCTKQNSDTQKPQHSQENVTAGAEGLYYCCRQIEDSNALILDPKAKKPSPKAAPEVPQKKLSKSQKRKLKKIEEDKLKRAERTQVSLDACALHIKRSAQKVCYHTIKVSCISFVIRDI